MFFLLVGCFVRGGGRFGDGGGGLVREGLVGGGEGVSLVVVGGGRKGLARKFCPGRGGVCLGGFCPE